MIVYTKGSEKPQSSIERILVKDILPTLSLNLRSIIGAIPLEVIKTLQEIRLRKGRPLMVVTGTGDYYIKPGGKPIEFLENTYIVSEDDIGKTLEIMSDSSLYALEEELKNGYLTLPGGHRVGIVGKVVMDLGQIKTMKSISGLNIRISRALPGVANKVISRITDVSGPLNTLIVSPPRCGKTTLLRDIVRKFSNGVPEMGLPGFKVGLVDERSEIASCYEGVPRNDVGPRTDILDACPKAYGMIMLIRSMSPDIIATDEIGKKEDAEALEDALNAGVKVIVTAHGRDIDEIQKRPYIKHLIESNVFQRIVVLSQRNGAGTVEGVYDACTMTPILHKEPVDRGVMLRC